MSKQIAYLFAAILLSAVLVQAQDAGDAPFAVLERAVKEELDGWNGSKERLSIVFDIERKRLGPQFESELVKWLGNHPEKHYWISFFLESEGYLHGSQRLPELSLLIKQQGLTLVQGKDDDDSKGYVIGLSITAAILSDELGLRALASAYKSEAERMLIRDPSLSKHVPAVSDAQRRRYDEIKTSIRRGVTTVIGAPANPESTRYPHSPPTAPISGGILNGKALKLVKPIFPQEAREVFASGVVVVRVLIDETGKVIKAEAISGHPKLRQASEEAALQSEFLPTKLSGVPVKVTGVIQYNFVAVRH